MSKIPDVPKGDCPGPCSVCEGDGGEWIGHHWMPDFSGEGDDDDPLDEPVMACKHCPATKPFEFEDEDDDGQPSEAQEWRDFNADC